MRASSLSVVPPGGSKVRLAGRFRGMSEGEGSCALGLGCDGAGVGGVFWGEPLPPFLRVSKLICRKRG
jgi:hypothetical protein